MQNSKKLSLYLLYCSAVVFFVLGLYYPIMVTKIFLGLKKDSTYLVDTIFYFYEEKEYFIGTLILVFSLVLPILKFVIVGLRLVDVSFPYKKIIINSLDSINKWAMLDVFVVALVIVNMKMDSLFIKTKLEIGTSYFALSIMLLTICTQLLSKQEKKIRQSY